MATCEISNVVRLCDYDGVAKSLDEEILVYQPASGSVQLIDQLGHELLKLIQQSPQTIEQLTLSIKENFTIDEIENLETAILKTISHFQSVDLVELDAE